MKTVILLTALLSAAGVKANPDQWLLLHAQQTSSTKTVLDTRLDGVPVQLSEAVSACEPVVGLAAYAINERFCVPLVSRPDLLSLANGLTIQGLAEQTTLEEVLADGEVVVLSETQQLACLPGFCPVALAPGPACDDQPECDRIFRNGFE